jgi:hypothetical protein
MSGESYKARQLSDFLVPLQVSVEEFSIFSMQIVPEARK